MSAKTPDEGCICRGNWRAIIKKYEALIGRQFVNSHDNKTYQFFGVVHGNDDYYYGMWSPEFGLTLLSCVGDLEGHGFTLVQ